MPSIKASAWSLRLAAFAGWEESLRPWCEERGVVLAVKEFGDDESPNQEHFHLLLRTELVTDPTIRNWVKALVGETPRSSKALKPLAEEAVENYLRYCCKGPNWHDVKLKKTSDREPPTVVFTTLLPPTIKAYHDEFWKVNTANGAQRKKAKVVTPDEIVDLCVQYLRPKGHTDYWECCNHATDWLAKYYKYRRADQHLYPMVQSVMWHMDAFHTRQMVQRRMRERMDRYNQPLIMMNTEAAAPERDNYGNLISHD